MRGGTFRACPAGCQPKAVAIRTCKLLQHDINDNYRSEKQLRGTQGNHRLLSYWNLSSSSWSYTEAFLVMCDVMGQIDQKHISSHSGNGRWNSARAFWAVVTGRLADLVAVVPHRTRNTQCLFCSLICQAHACVGKRQGRVECNGTFCHLVSFFIMQLSLRIWREQRLTVLTLDETCPNHIHIHQHSSTLNHIESTNTNRKWQEMTGKQLLRALCFQVAPRMGWYVPFLHAAQVLEELAPARAPCDSYPWNMVKTWILKVWLWNMLMYIFLIQQYTTH